MIGQASLTTQSPQFNLAVNTWSPAPGSTFFIGGVRATSNNEGTVERAAQQFFMKNCTRKQFDKTTDVMTFLPCSDNAVSRFARALMRRLSLNVTPMVPMWYAIRGIPQENTTPCQFRAVAETLHGPQHALVLEKPSDYEQGFTSIPDVNRTTPRQPTACYPDPRAKVLTLNDGTCEYREETKLGHWEMVPVPCERDVTEADAGSSTAPTDEASDVTQADAEIRTTQAGAEGAVTQTSKKRNVTPADGGILERAPEAQAGWPMVVALMGAGVISLPLLVLYLLLANRSHGQSEQKQDEEAQRNARPLLDPQYA